MLVLFSLIISLVSVICWIIVLTKLFPAKGVGWGIFGIICGLYAFIWGWQNANRQNIFNVMLAWSISVGLSIILNAAVASSGN